MDSRKQKLAERRATDQMSGCENLNDGDSYIQEIIAIYASIAFFLVADIPFQMTIVLASVS